MKVTLEKAMVYFDKENYRNAITELDYIIQQILKFSDSGSILAFLESADLKYFAFGEEETYLWVKQLDVYGHILPDRVLFVVFK